MNPVARHERGVPNQRKVLNQPRHHHRRTSGKLGAVIGQTKFHYDVWGQAVNMASRMMSQGLPGKIQITPETCKLLKQGYACERRGVIDVKGAGEMETWFLESRKA